MPAISVIVPVYKVEKFLPRCVDSILNQLLGERGYARLKKLLGKGGE